MMKPRVKLIFAWFDIWIGFFWDSKKRKLYFFPFPMFGIVLDFVDYDALAKELSDKIRDMSIKQRQELERRLIEGK